MAVSIHKLTLTEVRRRLADLERTYGRYDPTFPRADLQTDVVIGWQMLLASERVLTERQPKEGKMAQRKLQPVVESLAEEDLAESPEEQSYVAQTEERLLVETSRGVFRITVPKGAKVTFGPLLPPSQRFEEGGRKNYLRVYKTQNQQLAVIDDVYRFCAESLGMEKAEGEGSWRPYTEGDALATLVNRNLQRQQAVETEAQFLTGTSTSTSGYTTTTPSSGAYQQVFHFSYTDDAAAKSLRTTGRTR